MLSPIKARTNGSRRDKTNGSGRDKTLKHETCSIHGYSFVIYFIIILHRKYIPKIFNIFGFWATWPSVCFCLPRFMSHLLLETPSNIEISA